MPDHSLVSDSPFVIKLAESVIAEDISGSIMFCKVKHSFIGFDTCCDDMYLYVVWKVTLNFVVICLKYAANRCVKDNNESIIRIEQRNDRFESGEANESVVVVAEIISVDHNGINDAGSTIGNSARSFLGLFVIALKSLDLAVFLAHDFTWTSIAQFSFTLLVNHGFFV